MFKFNFQKPQHKIKIWLEILLVAMLKGGLLRAVEKSQAFYFKGGCKMAYKIPDELSDWLGDGARKMSLVIPALEDLFKCSNNDEVDWAFSASIDICKEVCEKLIALESNKLHCED